VYGLTLFIQICLINYLTALCLALRVSVNCEERNGGGQKHLRNLEPLVIINNSLFIIHGLFGTLYFAMVHDI